MKVAILLYYAVALLIAWRLADCPPLSAAPSVPPAAGSSAAPIAVAPAPGEAAPAAAGKEAGAESAASAKPEERKPATERFRLACASGGRRLFLLVILAGLVGGVLHGMTSLAAHSGGGRLDRRWWVFYVSRPFVGGGMAFVVALVLRSGLVGFSVPDGDAGLRVLLGWGALAGLFSSPALRKLQEVFDGIWTNDEGKGGGKGTTKKGPAGQPTPQQTQQTSGSGATPEPQ
jgi:hypothetical protein